MAEGGITDRVWRRYDLTVDSEKILEAYRRGLFPMADPDRGGEVDWYAADPRGILPLDERFHISGSLARVARSGRFQIRADTAFRSIMRGCASPRHYEKRTWISAGMIRAYTRLHEEGWAHSVEAWRIDPDSGGERLVGGLYGIAIAGVFFGESMYVDIEQGGRDSSKVCLIALVQHLRRRGYVLLDAQVGNPHVARFGCIEVPAVVFESLLAAALTRTDTSWGRFEFDPTCIRASRRS